MKLAWLDDLVALAETGNLTKAAERRNVSQPAFSRRIRIIEEWLGAPVVEHGSKPARASPAIHRHIEDIKEMSRNLRRFRNDVRGWDRSQRRLAIATQHTLSITFFPSFIGSLQSTNPRSIVRLRSANRDEAYAMLMTGQAAILVVYETADFPLTVDAALLEKVCIRRDTVIPVAEKSMTAALLQVEERQVMKVIGFPDDVFFGRILNAQVFPALTQAGTNIAAVCETALVPAVMQLALAGVGIAWLPRSIVNALDQTHRLRDLSGSLPSYEIDVIAARLKTPRAAFAELAWQRLLASKT
jgi:DNA-binding transcriptional LysR family regulator